MKLRVPIEATRAERQMAVPLVMLLVLVPSMLMIGVRIMGNAGAWPLWIPMILLLGLLIVILVGVYRRNRAALTPAAWGYAFGWTGLVQLVFGLFILVTGRTPNKYSHVSVPRSNAVINFLLAALWWAVALALSRWNARKRRDF